MDDETKKRAYLAFGMAAVCVILAVLMYLFVLPASREPMVSLDEVDIPEGSVVEIVDDEAQGGATPE